MRRRGSYARQVTRLVLALVALLVILAALLFVVPRCSRPSSAELTREVERELPVGSSAAEIEAWFERRGEAVEGATWRFSPGGRPDSSEQEAYYWGRWRRGGAGGIEVQVKVYVDGQRRAVRVVATDAGCLLP